MKVRELIKELLDCNLDAEMNVIAHNKGEDVTLSWSGRDGASKESAKNVNIDVDSLNDQENSN